MTKRLALAVAVIGGLVFCGLALAAGQVKLAGTVGPGFTIGLKSSAGAKVTTLKPGSYAFTVQDKSDIHSFFLKGPGVSNRQITGVGFQGAKTAIVALKPGKYAYYCSVHIFQGTFTVK